MALSFINTSGNIISEDFCQLLLSETKADYVKSKSFGADVKKVDEDIATTFELLREKWEEIRVKVLENQFDNSQLRDKWIKPLFSLLGFDMTFVSHNFKNNAGVEYHIPYKGWNTDDAPFIHMVHSSADLDSRDRTSRTHPNKSPHDILQQFLNTSPHKWAILTNGRRIRVLRDFFHSITKGFIEFDVEGIFESASTEQFRILYRLLHKSRFIGQYETKEEEAEETICLLEKFHTLSRDTGVKVGENLRKQVRIAIEALGNGFAENIDPDSLNEAEEKKFYSEILNIIYRLLFLLFAEQKGWLPVKNDVYARTYSINYLREKAEKGEYNFDNNEDLWEGLKITFKLVTNGYSFPDGDKINAFGGLLFSDEHINHIKSPLKNRHLLKAIDALCFFTDKNIRNKINYAALAIDELGSVYESLLDYEPKLLKEDTTIDDKPYNRGEFILDDRSSERKTSGSYYTDSRLVAQLIDSALVPVIENAIKDKTIDEDKRKAILDLKVADIACGSGAFLIAALEKLGEYLALISKDEGEKPTEDELRQAKRDIMQNCIYGVDLNPMALELAKFSLWITASMPNLPLSFLDHKLKCGNSLIGAIPDLIKKGIPVEAFNPVTLDNPELCSQLKKRIKKELQGYDKEDGGVQTLIKFKVSALMETDEDAQQYLHILHSRQENVNEVDNLVQEYEEVYHALRENIDWKLSDAWTAAFFIRKDDINKTYPTNLTLKEIAAGNAIDEDLEKEISVLSRKYRFFHWHLEFPEVYEKGGFDCILGNPPWERIKLQEKEFFKLSSYDVVSAKTKSKRSQEIANLKDNNSVLFNYYQFEKRSSDLQTQFYRHSHRYPYSACGDLNTYPIFIENALTIYSKIGRIGIIVPSGIATDSQFSELFAFFVKSKKLVSLFDFENRGGKYFPALHTKTKYCLLTLSNNYEVPAIFAFYLNYVNDIFNKNKTFSLSSDEFSVLNPETLTCPIFRTKNDAIIIKKIYSKVPILNSHNEGEKWNVDISEMFHMSLDSDKFIEFSDNSKSTINYLPLYEGKMIFIFNPRYSSALFSSNEEAIRGVNSTSTETELRDPSFVINPRFLVERKHMPLKYNSYKWFVVLRKISDVMNERTLITSIIPYSAVGNSLQTIVSSDKEELLSFYANTSVYVFDYILRQKLGGKNIAQFIINQLPFIKVHKLKDHILIVNGHQISLFEYIKSTIVELIYNHYNIKSFAIDFNVIGEPYPWNEEIRFNKKCLLDAIYGHLYNITHDDFDYILDTFPIVKRKEIEKFGVYRTKEVILKYFDDIKIIYPKVGSAK